MNKDKSKTPTWQRVAKVLVEELAPMLRKNAERLRVLEARVERLEKKL